MTQQEVYNLLKKHGGKLRKTFKFGKIAYSSLRKDNPVEVNVELRLEDEGRIEFSANGKIYNRLKSDLYCCGQCLDEINVFVHNPTFKTIYKMWQQYHLNGMHAGTKEQEEFVNRYFNEAGKRYDYTEACQALKDNNLYEVEYEGQPYKYGHGWIYEVIPEEDLDVIVKLLTEVK